MTVSAPTIYPETFSCNGVLTAFDFSFGVNATSEVEVIQRTAAGVETILTETADYVVSTTNDDYSSGGTVTTVLAYATGVTLTIRMIIAFTQISNFTENMSTLYETFEDALDKLTRIAQQLSEIFGRCLTFSKTSSYLGDGTMPDPEANKVLGWNAAGTVIENKTPSTVEAPDVMVNAITDYTIVADRLTVLCTGTFTVTLALAASSYLNSICNMSTGTITIVTQTGDTMEDSATVVLSGQYQVVTFRGDGTNTYIQMN